MSCTIIQGEDTRRPNEGETLVLHYLSALPAEYTVIREFAIAADWVKDLPDGDTRKHKQPDFLVIGPAIGIMTIEVKKWNLRGHRYSWENQQWVRREGGGGSSLIKNPYYQVKEYWEWLLGVLDKTGLIKVITASAACAFPTINRAELLNSMGNPPILAHPQAKEMLDIHGTLFAEDIAINDPHEWLVQQAKRSGHDPRTNRGSCDNLLRELFPKIDVGCLDRQSEFEQLERLTLQQEKWAFGLQDQGLLFDVAGSGKSTVLLSKAMHFIDRMAPEVCSVLITAYSEDLTRDLRSKLARKVGKNQNSSYYREMTIRDVPTILAQIAKECDVNLEEDDHSEYYGRELALAMSDIKPPVVYDAVFVDEVQDLGSYVLAILQSLCPENRLFFVGDLSQRLYKPLPDFLSLEIQTDAISLEPSFRTYRTPLWIAKLAFDFARRDRTTRRLLAEQGFDHDLESGSPVTTSSAVLIHCENRNQALKTLIVDINDTLRYATKSEVLIIAGPNTISPLLDELKAKRIDACQGQPEDGEEAIPVVSFKRSKGLERRHVRIIGIEDLSTPGDAPITASVDEKDELEGFMRRSIYVGLTRTMESLNVLYWDRNNIYLRDLLQIQETLDKQRMGMK